MKQALNQLFRKFLYFSIIIGLLSACNSKTTDTSFSGPTYPDNYSDITEVDHYKKWGPYNVHDPSCIKSGDYYYAYATDAYYFLDHGDPEEKMEISGSRKAKMDSIGFGKIPIRKSKDLINWEFVGWALDSIPQPAIDHIMEATGGRKPTNIWAPYITEWNGEFRLYYSASVYGANTSFIGMATSKTPEGPWIDKGAVVKSFKGEPMNAIDPSVVVDASNGKHWMHYGSYFGGLFCVELNPESGFVLNTGDKGHLIARRADFRSGNLEAPEIIYNPELKEYYLFTSYDALFTHYNVRVGRSKNPEGPFYDYFGNDLAETINDFPVLTYAYRFSGHIGWAGVAHCAVINDNGNYYMLHQGRLSPTNHFMVMHVRKIFWNSEGWPVVSPERYAGVPDKAIDKKQLTGKWEIIALKPIADSVKLWQGQVASSEWHYDTIMFNNSIPAEFLSNGDAKGLENTTWSFENNTLFLQNNKGKTELIVAPAWDWEKKKETIIFTGIQPNGFSMWGKKI